MRQGRTHSLCLYTNMTKGIHHTDWREEVQWWVEVNYTGKNLGTQDTEEIEGLGKCLTHLCNFVYLSKLDVCFKWIKTPLSDHSFIYFSREMVLISTKIILTIIKKILHKVFQQAGHKTFFSQVSTRHSVGKDVIWGGDIKWTFSIKMDFKPHPKWPAERNTVLSHMILFYQFF